MPNPAARLAECAAPPRLGRSFRWLLAHDRRHQRRRRRRAGRRAAAGRLRDARPAPRLDGASWPRTLPVLLFGFAAGVVADRVDRDPDHRRRQPRPGASSSRSSPRRSSTGAVNIGLVLVALFAARDRGDVRRRRRREHPAAARPARGPGHRERAALGRVLLTNQLMRAADRRVPVRVGMALPFAADAAVLRPRRPARHARRLLGGRRSLRPGRRARTTGAPRWPRASAGWPTTRRCGRCSSRSSRSTSRSAPRGRCSCSTRRSGWG